MSFILQHENIYIQRKKGAENHHVIETYKCMAGTKTLRELLILLMMDLNSGSQMK